MRPRTSWWLPRGPSEAPKRETSWGPRRLPQQLVLFSRFSEADSWEWGVSRSVPSGRVRREGAARALVVSRPRPGFLPRGRAPFTHPWGPVVPRPHVPCLGCPHAGERPPASQAPHSAVPPPWGQVGARPFRDGDRPQRGRFWSSLRRRRQRHTADGSAAHAAVSTLAPGTQQGLCSAGPT